MFNSSFKSLYSIYLWFNEARGKDWRERLLRSSRRKPTITTDEREPLTQEERNVAREEEARQDGYNEEENRNHQNDVETERQHNRRQEPPRRQLPQRTRRPPPKLKDYTQIQTIRHKPRGLYYPGKSCDLHVTSFHFRVAKRATHVQ